MYVVLGEVKLLKKTFWAIGLYPLYEEGKKALS